MNFKTVVGRKLARRFLGMLHPSVELDTSKRCEEAELMRLVGDGVVKAKATLGQMTASGTGSAGCDPAAIAKLIDEIAFQTNILAIQSAVYASAAVDTNFPARTGEFRDLADRCSAAAAESAHKVNFDRPTLLH